MWYMVIGIALTFGCVHAAFTIDVHNDVEHPLTTEAVTDCDYRACDQLCRRLGFPGGACVGDRCKCDNFKQVPVQDALNSASILVQSCNYQACDQLCRRLGFPGGACIGDRCKCDNFKQAQDENEITIKENEITENENEIPAYGEHRIAKAHYDGEDVVAGNLNAHIGVLKDDEGSDIMVRSSSNRDSCDCDPRSCDMYCFRIRYIGGICLTGQCRCYK